MPPFKQLTLIGDKIAVSFNKSERQIGNLYIPDDHIQMVQEATVEYLGSSISELIFIGDKVLVKITDSSPIFKANGKELRIYSVKDVLALV